MRRAAGDDDKAAADALAKLCETYWYPIYVFIRRSNHAPADAEDLTQDFFARMIRLESFAAADAAKGKLRTFLLTSVRNFLTDAHDRAQAAKRGARVLVSFDREDAEKSYAREPADEMSPDRLFQRRWAMAMVESSLARLRVEFASQGKAEIFERLRPFLGFGSKVGGSYEEVASQSQMAVGTVKSHVFRLRQRWRELLFEQVAETLENPTPGQIKAELTELLGCL